MFSSSPPKPLSNINESPIKSTQPAKKDTLFKEDLQKDLFPATSLHNQDDEFDEFDSFVSTENPSATKIESSGEAFASPFGSNEGFLSGSKISSAPIISSGFPGFETYGSTLPKDNLSQNVPKISSTPIISSDFPGFETFGTPLPVEKPTVTKQFNNIENTGTQIFPEPQLSKDPFGGIENPSQKLPTDLFGEFEKPVQKLPNDLFGIENPSQKLTNDPFGGMEKPTQKLSDLPFGGIENPSNNGIGLSVKPLESKLEINNTMQFNTSQPVLSQEANKAKSKSDADFDEFDDFGEYVSGDIESFPEFETPPQKTNEAIAGIPASFTDPMTLSAPEILNNTNDEVPGPTKSTTSGERQVEEVNVLPKVGEVENVTAKRDESNLACDAKLILEERFEEAMAYRDHMKYHPIVTNLQAQYEEEKKNMKILESIETKQKLDKLSKYLVPKDTQDQWLQKNPNNNILKFKDMEDKLITAIGEKKSSLWLNKFRNIQIKTTTDTELENIALQKHIAENLMRILLSNQPIQNLNEETLKKYKLVLKAVISQFKETDNWFSLINQKANPNSRNELLQQIETHQKVKEYFQGLRNVYLVGKRVTSSAIFEESLVDGSKQSIIDQDLKDLLSQFHQQWQQLSTNAAKINLDKGLATEFEEPIPMLSSSSKKCNICTCYIRKLESPIHWVGKDYHLECLNFWTNKIDHQPI
eukprot:TRINITY_DN934_c0_g1_i4.p1 TRINITY_DN934_c0_g1~~TRINITY_DN934_c0_g1_i4.p1  ORF type:complete len:700 (-),score=221.26 TRINITY_DN934_c0_g1_i4:106-2205(-)